EHFQEEKVRQALAHALDKNAIVTTVAGEFGKVVDDIFPSTHWSHNPNLPEFEYDITKAENLLEEAGYEKNNSGIYEINGEELNFVIDVPTGDKSREQSAPLIKQMWE